MTIKARHPPVAPAPRSIRHTLTVDPARLSAQDKQSFTDSLYQLHCQIFDGVSRESFQSTVFDPSAEYNRIRIYMNGGREWVGYCAVHRVEKQITRRRRVIFKAEAGLLRPYRESSQTLWFAFEQAVKYRLCHPLASIYYFGLFIHPAVLYMLSKYFSQGYPLPGREIPPQFKDMMLELAEEFGLKPVNGQSYLVREEEWITRESDTDTQYWQANPNPVVQFYIRTNPRYGHGSSLMVLVPLTFGNVFLSLARFLKRKLFG